MNRRTWTEAEELILENLAGTLPFSELVAKYNRAAAKNDWPPRSADAISVRLRCLGHSRLPQLDHFSMMGLARELGIDINRVWRWVKEHHLPYRKLSRSKGAIALSDFKEWALKNQHRLHGINLNTIQWLIGFNFQVPEDIKKPGMPQPTVRLDTGEIYPSVSAAAKANFIARESLFDALKRNRPCAGIQFRRAEERTCSLS